MPIMVLSLSVFMLRCGCVSAEVNVGGYEWLTGALLVPPWPPQMIKPAEVGSSTRFITVYFRYLYFTFSLLLLLPTFEHKHLYFLPLTFSKQDPYFSFNASESLRDTLNTTRLISVLKLSGFSYFLTFVAARDALPT